MCLFYVSECPECPEKGSSCVVHCDSGYLGGTMRCNEDGNWDDTDLDGCNPETGVQLPGKFHDESRNYDDESGRVSHYFWYV